MTTRPRFGLSPFLGRDEGQGSDLMSILGGEEGETRPRGGRKLREQAEAVKLQAQLLPGAGGSVMERCGAALSLHTGLARPDLGVAGLHVFAVESGLGNRPEPLGVARALRRAVMARAQQAVGESVLLSPFFTGHERDGAPANGERHPHLSFAFEPRSSRLIVVAPHLVARRAATAQERTQLAVLDGAIDGFRELRAGSGGCLVLQKVVVDTPTDPITAPSRVWENTTAYQVTQHAKRVGATETVTRDVCVECRRCGLPEPQAVVPLSIRGISGVGLVGMLRLTFPVAVSGPVLLGRSRHVGGGLFLGQGSGTG